MSLSLSLSKEKYTPASLCVTGLYADYVFSKDKYAPVTRSSPMYAVDCEMVTSPPLM